LQELGYTEGPSLTIHYRFAEGNQSRLQDQVTDLVRLKMDVIVACTSRAAVAAHKETQTIPIVMINVGDPIRIGLVASLARPGGNVTGTASYLPELAGKHLEILKELVPGMKHLAVLWTPDNPLHASNLRDLDEPARLLGVQVHALRVLGPGDFESAFRTAVNERASAAWIFGDPMFIDNRNRLSALAVNIRMPTMFTARQFADAGGLVVYAPVASESYLRAATFVDKILKGAKPSDLPVEQPTKFELIINLKTAKAIGLTIPQSLLVRADEIIQ
jgi:putative ABC transport system substrate-binding protein